MEFVLGLLCALSLLAGLVLGISCNWHRLPGAPTIPSLNPVHWFRPWSIKDELTPKGLKLYLASYICIMIGLALYAITYGIGPLI
jgi:hypothetical protein